MKFPTLLSGSLAVMSLSSVHATNWYWDADADTSASTGGTGNWTLAGSLWRSASSTGALTAYNDAAGPQNDTAANLVLAGGTDSLTTTLSASATYNLNKITASNTYTLATNTATAAFVGTAPTVDVASGKSLVWGIDLSAASATVTKSGTGIWQFNNTGGQVVSNNTTLDVTAGTLQFNTNAATANLFTGTGGIVKVGSGATLSLIQTNNGGYTSAKNWTLGSKVILNGGSLNGGSSNGAQFQRLTSGTAVQVDAASTIALTSGNYSQNLTLEGSFTGSGALNLNRSNSNTKYLNLKGDMSGYSGNVTIGTSTAAGYVLFGHSSGWGSGNLTLTGAGSRVMIGDEAATTYNSSWTGGSALAHTTGTFSPAGAITVGSGAELALMNSTASYGILFSPANGITVNGGTLSAKGTAGSSAFVPASGSTWIFGGTALSTISGNIQLDNTGATFQVADAIPGTAVDTTISGMVSGTNGFIKTGGGTLSVTADNSLAGGVVIDNGTIQVDSTATLGTGTVTIGQTDTSAATHSLRLNGATIDNNVVTKFMYTADYLGTITAMGGSVSTINGDITVNPAVSGAPSRGGHLAATGTGSVLRLMGELNVGGGQTVITQRDGVVEYGGGSSTGYQLQVTNTARLAADNGIGSGVNVQLGVSGNATLDLNGFSTGIESVTRSGNTTTVTNLGSSASTLTLGAATDRTYSGSIVDGTGGVSLVKQGSSVLTLSGINTYTGDTTVSAGTLVVDGSLGTTSTTIASGATLGGSGAIDGPTTINGIHSPGNSPGLQTFTGGLSYSDTAHLNWELTDNTTIARGTAYDGVDATGGTISLDSSATIDLSFGGTVDFLDTFWGTDQEWLVVDLSGSATATDSNTFTIGSITGGSNYSASLGNFSVLRKDGSTTEDAVYLTWTPVPEPAAALLGGIGVLVLLRRRTRRNP